MTHPVLAALDRIDRLLVAAGFPATSPWWRAELGRFLTSGRRRWVIRAGRRAGKSSTLCRLAVAVALAGDWSIPPGDRAVIAIVSVDRDEAAGRLRTIRAILDALHVPYTERGDEIELPDRRLAFAVTTCSVRGTVGFTSVLVIGDEMARWESRDDKANPAREVMASLRPTMATVPSAFEVDVSSPWGTDDYHAELFDAGDDDHQITSFAATWTANPTLTEARTRELEPDDRVWSREYAAEPGATLSAALDAVDVAAAFGLAPSPTGSPFCAIDASSLRGDAFTWILGHTEDDRFSVTEVDGVEGDALRHVSMAEVVRRIADGAKAHGCDVIFGDQRESASLESLFAEHEVTLKTIPWSQPSKDAAFSWLRRAFREKRIALCEHVGLRRELGAVKARLVPSGATLYQTNGLDYLSSLVTLAHAAVAGDVGGPSSMWGSDEQAEAARAVNASFTSRFDTTGPLDDLFPGYSPGGRGLW
ncbi:MAG TPA: hypothetical protein PLU22_00920 [Polyangiaceae bacterium]|nr:hypothetical protein [Polyangiaceae bacterium]